MLSSSASEPRMNAAVIPAPGSISICVEPVPALAPDDVLIKVHYAGICGTDLHLLHGSARNASYPLIPGHEFSGEVVAVGESVRDVPVGVPVVAEGRAGTGFRRAGAFAEYVSVPREMLHTLPSGVDLLEAALVDPLACAINAVNQGRLMSRDRVVIVGQGSSGLCMLQAARAMIGCDVAVADPREERLALSRQLGAALAVNPRATDASATLREWAGPGGVDVILEATGQESGIDLALGLVRRDSRIVVYGVHGQRISFEIDQVVYNQVEMIGAVGSRGCWPRAVELLARRQVDLRSIISRVVPLQRLPEALRSLDAGEGAIKIVVAPAS